MRFLKKLLTFLVVLVVLLVGIAFVLPKTSHVERSTTINRPASEVFALINNLHRFNAWSPWFDLDPNAKYTMTGPVSGVGAKQSWVGNKDVGSGSMEIVASKPNELVTTALDFGDMGKPTANMRLAPDGSGTKITWTLDQSFESSLIGRYFGLMMDSMVGKDYEKGLAKLKVLLETFPAADISGVNGEVVELASQKIYFVSATSTADPADAKTVLTDAYGKIGAFIQAHGIAMQGAPMTVTTSFAANEWKFDAAIAVDRNDVADDDTVKSGGTYAGKAVRFIHTGPYDKIGDTTSKAYAWLAVQGMKPKDRLIEEYINDPTTTPVDQLQTRLNIPVE